MKITTTIYVANLFSMPAPIASYGDDQYRSISRFPRHRWWPCFLDRNAQAEYKKFLRQETDAWSFVVICCVFWTGLVLLSGAISVAAELSYLLRVCAFIVGLSSVCGFIFLVLSAINLSRPTEYSRFILALFITGLTLGLGLALIGRVLNGTCQGEHEPLITCNLGDGNIPFYHGAVLIVFVYVSAKQTRGLTSFWVPFITWVISSSTIVLPRRAWRHSRRRSKLSSEPSRTT